MDEPLHTPDFTAPDFTQPELQPMQAGFVLPDPLKPETAVQLPLWSDDELERLNVQQPDPLDPDLTELDAPPDLSRPDASAHMLPQPRYQPETVMTERPGELDPHALPTLWDGVDWSDLPAGVTYPQLYTDQDGMSTRKRHLGMLDLGLEQSERDER